MAGFSLLELVIVVLVLGVLSLIGTPILLQSMEHANLAEISTTVTSAMNFARMASQGTGRSHRVTFDIAAETLRVEEQQNPQITALRTGTTVAATTVETAATWQTATHPVERIPYVIDLDGRFGPRAGIHTASFNGDAIIVFSYPGTPDSNGTVVVRLGSLQKTISVNALSGQLSVS